MSKRQPKDGLSFENEELPYCCGIEVIGSLAFEEGVWSSSYDEITRAAYKKLPSTSGYGDLAKSDYEAQDGGCEVSLPRKMALMATTIAGQRDEIKRLQALRFTKVWSFKNKHTGNVVSVWFRKPL